MINALYHPSLPTSSDC